MSGHNKWSTIKQKKGKNDAARAKVFTKIGRELIVAIREGGSADPSVNSKPVSYTHLDVYKRQVLYWNMLRPVQFLIIL